MELIKGILSIMRQLQDEGMVPFGGMVKPEFYEKTKELNDHFKEEFDGLAEDERQKELHAKVWPY